MKSNLIKEPNSQTMEFREGSYARFMNHLHSHVSTFSCRNFKTSPYVVPIQIDQTCDHRFGLLFISEVL